MPRRGMSATRGAGPGGWWVVPRGGGRRSGWGGGGPWLWAGGPPCWWGGWSIPVSGDWRWIVRGGVACLGWGCAAGGCRSCVPGWCLLPRLRLPSPWSPPLPRGPWAVGGGPLLAPGSLWCPRPRCRLEGALTGSLPWSHNRCTFFLIYFAFFLLFRGICVLGGRCPAFWPGAAGGSVWAATGSPVGLPPVRFPHPCSGARTAPLLARTWPPRSQ